MLGAPLGFTYNLLSIVVYVLGSREGGYVGGVIPLEGGDGVEADAIDPRRTRLT